MGQRMNRKRKARKAAGLACIAAGLLSLGAAGLLFLRNERLELAAQAVNSGILPRLESALLKAQENTEDSAENGSQSLFDGMQEPSIEIDGRRYLGILTIPSLQLQLPVLADCTEENLKLGPCRYDGTVADHNMIIAGHNYRRQLSPIKQLQPGAVISFLDVAGNETVYEVSERALIGGLETEEMYAGEWDLTVFTCNLGGKSRVTLRCSETAGYRKLRNEFF